MHPEIKERNYINYEIVELVIPSVFLGSFIGVELGELLGNTI
jgi:hypothetical protein